MLSISSAISSFSNKNFLAFSLPCPILLPLKLYHDPDFSTKPPATPKSIISPSFDMPSPYKISNSVILKGGATLFFTTLTLV